MKKIISDTCFIKKIDNLSSEYIENELKNCFGEIIRWAVTSVDDNQLKLSITYEKEV